MYSNDQVKTPVLKGEGGTRQALRAQSSLQAQLDELRQDHFNLAAHVPRQAQGRRLGG